MSKDTIIIAAVVIIGGAILLAPFIPILIKSTHMGYYTSVSLGMPEEAMLKIMGKGYNRSLLADGRIKYEWRLNATSQTDFGVREYSGVKKVDIYVRDGVVEEVKPYNITT